MKDCGPKLKAREVKPLQRNRAGNNCDGHCNDVRVSDTIVSLIGKAILYRYSQQQGYR